MLILEGTDYPKLQDIDYLGAGGQGGRVGGEQLRSLRDLLFHG